MSRIISIRPSGTTENSNPHILFTGTGDNQIIEMTTDGLRFSSETGGQMVLISDSATPLTFLENSQKGIYDGGVENLGDIYVGSGGNFTKIISKGGIWDGPETNLKGFKGSKGSKGDAGAVGEKGPK